MFHKVLIANRGEIACRIIRTCQDMGIATVAIYSDADRDALHVEMADEAVFIGPPAPSESYLNMDAVIQAAKDTGATAVHPGYGFLSENAGFAKKLAKAGITFIGPSAKSIEAMGEKSKAKALMEKAGVPLVPGYHGEKQDMTFLKGVARKIGFPVLIKASAGGGGKGMRIVEDANGFKAGLESAKREAQSAFGNDHVLIEKYLTKPRHVEIQVFGDSQGNFVYLFERDCSLQRRHQKVVEEAPAPGLSDALRQKMGEAAVDAAAAIKYVGAGTGEFLLGEEGRFYFMEMNTRLQVEHPVTEEITGTDLVEWQLHVANGGELPLKQHELTMNGHAIEVRLYAEDPQNDFLPAAGKINYLRYPEESEHVRVESAVFESPMGDGDQVSIHYDPMIAKIVTHGQTRDQAIEHMIEALSDTRITGLKTNLEFLQNAVMHPAFQAGNVSTNFIDVYHDDLIPRNEAPDDLTLALASIGVMHHVLGRNTRPVGALSPWDDTTGWRQNGIAPQAIHFSHGDEDIMREVLVHKAGHFSVIDDDGYPQYFEVHTSRDDLAFDILVDGQWLNASIIVDGAKVDVLYDGLHYRFDWHDPLADFEGDAGGAGKLSAPMPGKIVAIKVNVGDQVKKGAPLVILEAMKMEHTITAPFDGEVQAVNANPGDQVDEKLELVSFK